MTKIPVSHHLLNYTSITSVSTYNRISVNSVRAAQCPYNHRHQSYLPAFPHRRLKIPPALICSSNYLFEQLSKNLSSHIFLLIVWIHHKTINCWKYIMDYKPIYMIFFILMVHSCNWTKTDKESMTLWNVWILRSIVSCYVILNIDFKVKMPMNIFKW